jgi:hypothetical protein
LQLPNDQIYLKLVIDGTPSKLGSGGPNPSIRTPAFPTNSMRMRQPHGGRYSRGAEQMAAMMVDLFRGRIHGQSPLV